MSKRDYYEILGIGKNATDDEIKRALPIKDYILSAIKLYDKNKKEYKN